MYTLLAYEINGKIKNEWAPKRPVHKCWKILFHEPSNIKEHNTCIGAILFYINHRLEVSKNLPFAFMFVHDFLCLILKLTYTIFYICEDFT